MGSESVGLSATTRFRRVVVPTEHGGWAFLLEPLILGLALAPSAAGVWIAVATCFTFLSHQPTKIWLDDFRRDVDSARTSIARWTTLVTLSIAASSLIAAVHLTSSRTAVPLLLAVPLAMLQLNDDLRLKGRSARAELCGGMAMTASAASIALAAGWSALPAAALSLLMLCRVVPTVLYVRARLRDENAALALSWSVAALFVVIALTAYRLVPLAAAAAFAILTIRTMTGVRAAAVRVGAKVIGISELGYGAATIVLLIVAYHLPEFGG